MVINTPDHNLVVNVFAAIVMDVMASVQTESATGPVKVTRVINAAELGAIVFLKPAQKRDPAAEARFPFTNMVTLEAGGHIIKKGPIVLGPF